MRPAWTIFIVALIAVLSYGLGYRQKNASEAIISHKILTHNVVFSITGGTFDANVTFVITEDTVLAKKHIIEHITDSVETPFNSRGFSVHDGQGNMIIWMPTFAGTSDEMATLVHEINHTTVAILVWASVPLTPSNAEEVFCYESAYLTREFFNNVNNFGL